MESLELKFSTCITNCFAAENARNPGKVYEVKVRGIRHLLCRYYPKLNYDIPGWQGIIKKTLEDYSDRGKARLPTYFLSRKKGGFWYYRAKQDTDEYQAALRYYYQYDDVPPVPAIGSARGRPSSGSGGGDRSFGNFHFSTGDNDKN